MHLYYSACSLQWSFQTQNVAISLSLSLSLSFHNYIRSRGAQSCVLQQIGPDY